MQQQIQIPTPCHENWDGMQQQEAGKFCGSCAKIVMDFTSWEVTDIAQYLKQNTHTCGRIKQSQLQTPVQLNDEAVLVNIAESNLTVFKKIAAAILLLFVIGASGCESITIGEAKTTEHELTGVTVLEQDTVKNTIDTSASKDTVTVPVSIGFINPTIVTTGVNKFPNPKQPNTIKPVEDFVVGEMVANIPEAPIDTNAIPKPLQKPITKPICPSNRVVMGDTILSAPEPEIMGKMIAHVVDTIPKLKK
jgi:hypothetical protein